jgi:hypothetical protein
MTPEQAYDKCNGKKNKDLEPFIIKDPHYSYYYAKEVIKGRWKEAELYFITKSSVWAYYYARDIIKGRWIEAEQYIINDSEIAFWYARDVIKGKLPENMHNAMIIHADYYAKRYFDLISRKYA